MVINNKLFQHYEMYGLLMSCCILCVWSVFLIDDELMKRSEREHERLEIENRHEDTPANNPYHEARVVV